MTNTMTAQNIDLSSWDILYIWWTKQEIRFHLEGSNVLWHDGLKARIVEQEETAVVRQRHSKHVTVATQQYRNCWKRCFLYSPSQGYITRTNWPSVVTWLTDWLEQSSSIRILILVLVRPMTVQMTNCPFGVVK
jgi:hypothetical protein